MRKAVIEVVFDRDHVEEGVLPTDGLDGVSNKMRSSQRFSACLVNYATEGVSLRGRII